MVKCTPVPLPPIPGMAQPPASAPPPPRPKPLAERDPNPLAAAAAAAASKPTAGTGKRGNKRKSTDAAAPDGSNDDMRALLFPPGLEEIDDDDPRLPPAVSDSCNVVRRKIRTWIESGAQDVEEFQSQLGLSPDDYSRFMQRTRTWDGLNSDVYSRARLFFAKRELLGLPLAVPKPKKSRTSSSSSPSSSKQSGNLDPKVAKLLDTCDDIELPLEGTALGVPVYDTPGEMRKKFRALLAKDGVTKGAFMRALSRMIPEDPTGVSAQNLKTFMNQRSVMDGNTSKSFYAGWLLFEKQRIRDGRPKSPFRIEMEARHGSRGVDREHNPKTGFLVLNGERPYINKWGELEVY